MFASGAIPSSIWMSRSPSALSAPDPAPPEIGITVMFEPAPPPGTGSEKWFTYATAFEIRNPTQFEMPIVRFWPRMLFVKRFAVS
jgi:hypothetical protein